MSKNLFAVLIITLLFAFSYQQDESGEKPIFTLEDENIYSMTYRQFEELKAMNKSMLVLFWTPDCRHCHIVVPAFKELAAMAKKDEFGFKICAIDAKTYQKVAKEENLKVFPVVKLYHHSYTRFYESTRPAKQMYDYLKRILYGTFRKAKTVDEVEEIVKESYISMLVTLDPEKEKEQFDIFVNFTDIREEAVYIHCYSQECKDHYNTKVAYFKPFDEKVVNMDPNMEFTVRNLAIFESAYKFPIATTMNEYFASEIFKEGRPMLIYFRDQTDKPSCAKDDVFKEMHMKYRYNLTVFINDIVGSDMQQAFAKIYGIDKYDLPTAFIIKPSRANNRAYKFQRKDLEDFNVLKLSVFVEEYFKGNLKRAPRSDTLPEDQPKTFKVLVGKNWDEEVMQNDMNVLAYFAIGTDDKARNKFGACWMKSVEILKDVQDLKVVGIDLSKNEVIDFKREAGYKLFLKGQKDKPISFECKDKDCTEVDINEFLEWISDNLKIPKFPHVEMKKKEEEKKEDKKEEEKKEDKKEEKKEDKKETKIEL